MSNSSVTPWTRGYQAPLSMGFRRQDHWSGLPFPSPGNVPDPGIKPTSSPSVGRIDFMCQILYMNCLPVLLVPRDVWLTYVHNKPYNKRLPYYGVCVSKRKRRQGFGNAAGACSKGYTAAPESLGIPPSPPFTICHNFCIILCSLTYDGIALNY